MNEYHIGLLTITLPILLVLLFLRTRSALRDRKWARENPEEAWKCYQRGGF